MHIAMTNWAGGAARLGPTLAEAAEAAGFDGASNCCWLRKGK